MAQYTYITLNDGTKWRVKGNVQPQVGSGPYRYVATSDESPTVKSTAAAKAKNSASASSTAKTAAAATAAAQSAAARAAEAAARKAEAEAKKAAAEAKARREAELEAQAKEKARQERIAAINSSKASELLQLGDSYNAQKKSAGMVSDDNMRQLYIAYMQGLKGIPQQSALWGAGGEIESLKNRSRINYEDNRARENRSYAGILGEIQQKYNDDLRELEARYLQRLLDV